MCIFRPATTKDIEPIWQILLQAKAQMYSEGKHQWSEEYPVVANIQEDIKNEAAYVLEKEGEVISYGAVVFSGEEAYNLLKEGKWLSSDSYVVVHRLAVCNKMKRQGIAKLFMRSVISLALSKGVHSFRIDTNYDNFYMLHLFKSLDFSYCGKVYYTSGERLAYEKPLSAK